MEDGGWSGNFGFQPCLDVLLTAFLRFEAVGDDDNGPVWEDVPEQCGKKRLGGLRHAGTSQRTALLQSPREGLRSGSLGNSGEQIACRRDWEILRQARASSQETQEASSDGQSAHQKSRQKTLASPVGCVSNGHVGVR